ncbi:type II toxin-antitoxin system VapB family antitoxin [Archaeoglobus neptunius]|uniref:type II toxin-antitoxin system VapB family antitoxin n=1 Tax=Archaeoglobus neptunius TaxID=2798580 RepID=UPI001925E736|nr:hypothetical protein [Archaeoglobus neptunius]
MTKVVYSVRIPEEIKKMMEGVDVNWQDEIRRFIERRVRDEYAKKLLMEGRELRNRMKSSVSAAKLIREDRDGR